jgi:hypothetical protein
MSQELEEKASMHPPYFPGVYFTYKASRSSRRKRHQALNVLIPSHNLLSPVSSILLCWQIHSFIKFQTHLNFLHNEIYRTYSFGLGCLNLSLRCAKQQAGR